MLAAGRASSRLPPTAITRGLAPVRSTKRLGSRRRKTIRKRLSDISSSSQATYGSFPSKVRLGDGDFEAALYEQVYFAPVSDFLIRSLFFHDESVCGEITKTQPRCRMSQWWDGFNQFDAAAVG
jgi:hypothetical protein